MDLISVTAGRACNGEKPAGTQWRSACIRSAGTLRGIRGGRERCNLFLAIENQAEAAQRTGVFEETPPFARYRDGIDDRYDG